jgi:hypothetical protein
MQEAMNHVLGIAIKLDPTGKLDNFVFDDEHAQLPVPATSYNFETYIADQVLNEDKIRKWGGTCYAGVTHEMQNHYFGRRGGFLGFFQKKKSKQDYLPALCFIFTDGENSDHSEAQEAFERARDFPIFFCLVGIGPHAFSFLKRMERQESDVEFVNLSNMRISDDELYNKIVSPKLVNWLRQHPPGS